MNVLRILAIVTIFAEFLLPQNRWQYPITPDDPKWLELETLDDIISVQQIPENVLLQMSTDELFQAWMDLPGRMEVLAFNTLQQGFNETIKRYNVLRELLGRDDVGPIILEKFQKINIYKIEEETSDEAKGKVISDIGFIEMLLSQPEVLRTLSTTEKKLCVKKAISMMHNKLSLKSDDRDPFWEGTGLILMARILKEDRYPEMLDFISLTPAIERSITYCEYFMNFDTFDVFNEILRIAENYSSE